MINDGVFQRKTLFIFMCGGCLSSKGTLIQRISGRAHIGMPWKCIQPVFLYPFELTGLVSVAEQCRPGICPLHLHTLSLPSALSFSL